MEQTKQKSKTYHLDTIGKVHRDKHGMYLQIDEPYRPALEGLDGFSHAQVLWWFDKSDDEASRSTTKFNPPFDAPILGVFALKAPTRPNPIGLSTVRIVSVDKESGIVMIPRIDAFDGTPLLDIKPYLPSFDRVDNTRVPNWAAHWPDSMPEDGISLDPGPNQ